MQNINIQSLQEEKYTAIDLLIEAILEEWPDHKNFLEKSLGNKTPDVLERLNKTADLALVLIDNNLKKYVADYHWMCDRFREEQLYFARHKKYRLSSLEEAVREIYGNDTYMSCYVNGILLSQIFWSNHSHAMDIFQTEFLPQNKKNYTHLDIGPGHGLFLVFAAQDKNCKTLTAWDISPSSLKSTASALKKMKIKRNVSLQPIDIVTTNPEPEQFDSIICSEVLEHTENPEKALDNILKALKENGRAFLNIPVNSPAPDHIYLWTKPEEIKEIIIDHKFKIETFKELPPTGRTLEEAKKYNLDISCIAIVRKE